MRREQCGFRWSAWVGPRWFRFRLEFRCKSGPGHRGAHWDPWQ